MEEQKKEFTGVFIPKHILEDQELDAYDKILYAEIASFDECWKSNETLANNVGCSKSNITRRVAKLKSKKYIIQTRSDGRKRWLKAMADSPNKLGRVSGQPSQAKPPADIDNNINNNINIPETSSDSANQDNFNFPLKVNDWLTGKDEAYRLIAQMFLYKGLTFGSSAQMQSAARRHLRAARLIVPFTQEQRDEAFTRMLQNKSLGNEWTLDTLYKYLTK